MCWTDNSKSAPYTATEDVPVLHQACLPDDGRPSHLTRGARQPKVAVGKPHEGPRAHLLSGLVGPDLRAGDGGGAYAAERGSRRRSVGGSAAASSSQELQSLLPPTTRSARGDGLGVDSLALGRFRFHEMRGPQVWSTWTTREWCRSRPAPSGSSSVKFKKNEIK